MPPVAAIKKSRRHAVVSAAAQMKQNLLRQKEEQARFDELYVQYEAAMKEHWSKYNHVLCLQCDQEGFTGVELHNHHKMCGDCNLFAQNSAPRAF